MDSPLQLKDKLNICQSKLQFISDLFSQPEPFEFSEKGQAGLFHILEDITNSIRDISNSM